MRAPISIPLILLCLALGSCGPRSNDADPRLGDVERLVAFELRYEEGAELAEAVLADYPDTGRAELLLGLAIHKRKRYALAIPHFERALELAPFEKWETAHYYLGWARYWGGDLEGSRASFERYAELEPGQGDTQFGLGLVALEAEELDAALERFDAAIELYRVEFEGLETEQQVLLQSEVAKIYARRAEVFERREELEEAIESLRQCVNIYPPHYEAWYMLYAILDRLGEEGPAAEALRQHEYWKAQLNSSPEDEQ